MGITEATLAAYHVLATAFDDPTNGGTGKDEPMICTVNYGKGRSLYMLCDETYKGMWISPDVKVLLRTDNPTRDGPVAWISPYPKSRVVYIELGHGQTAHLHPAYRTLVQNAVRWSAGRLAEPGK
jgi:type 1 glutamine amidotransferase